LEISTCADNAGVAGPAAIGRSGAAAWTIVAQAQQAYFGRAIPTTRSCDSADISVARPSRPY
jgi:hypothetical protein